MTRKMPQTNPAEQPALDQAIVIPKGELSFSFACAGGPGGQNVNKRESKVTLQFDVMVSTALTSDQKRAVLNSEALQPYLNAERGIITITSIRFRTQLQNRKDVVEKLEALISVALKPQRERLPGGRPPHLGYPPSPRKLRQMKRETERRLSTSSNDPDDQNGPSK
jgi:ribosome-associated protein